MPSLNICKVVRLVLNYSKLLKNKCLCDDHEAPLNRASKHGEDPEPKTNLAVLTKTTRLNLILCLDYEHKVWMYRIIVLGFPKFYAQSLWKSLKFGKPCLEGFSY